MKTKRKPLAAVALCAIALAACSFSVIAATVPAQLPTSDGKPGNPAKPVKVYILGGCVGDRHFCGCGNPVHTFWDKECLLMRAGIQIPPMRAGFAYRLLVGGRSHYNASGGSDVWIDGIYLPNRNKNDATIEGGSGRNSYRPFGVIIKDGDRTHFADGKVLLAANGFLRWGHKMETIKSYQAFWFEEMKLPEIPAAPVAPK